MLADVVPDVLLELGNHSGRSSGDGILDVGHDVVAHLIESRCCPHAEDAIGIAAVVQIIERVVLHQNGVDGARGIDAQEVAAAGDGALFQREALVLTVAQVEHALAGAVILHHHAGEDDVLNIEHVGRVGGIDDALGEAIDLSVLDGHFLGHHTFGVVQVQEDIQAIGLDAEVLGGEASYRRAAELEAALYHGIGLTLEGERSRHGEGTAQVVFTGSQGDGVLTGSNGGQEFVHRLDHQFGAFTAALRQYGKGSNASGRFGVVDVVGTRVGIHVNVIGTRIQHAGSGTADDEFGLVHRAGLTVKYH